MDRSEITPERLRWFAGTSGPYTGRIRKALEMSADKIETLTGGHAGIIEMLGKRVTELSEENERLRLHLREIAAMGPADEEWDADTLEGAVALAKRALGDEQKEPSS